MGPCWAGKLSQPLPRCRCRPPGLCRVRRLFHGPEAPERPSREGSQDPEFDANQQGLAWLMDGFFTFLLLLFFTTGNLIQRFSCVKPQNIKWRKEGPRAYSLPTFAGPPETLFGPPVL